MSLSVTILRKRFAAGLIAVTLLFLFILLRLLYVEVIASSFYNSKAIGQWTRELPIKARRGRIISSDGKILADNKPSYAVYVRTKSVTDADAVSRVLSSLFDIDCDTLKDKIQKKSLSEITVKRGVDKNAVYDLIRYDLDGVYYSVDNSRIYPYGDMLASVIGFTSVDGTGISGLERYYDRYLKGVDGEILYESDLVGVDIEGKAPSYIEATDGLDIILSIDSEIQLITETALKKAVQRFSPVRASAVVIEPTSGSVLSMANLPSFDLNNPPRDDYELLSTLSRNAIVSDSYEPGSTFKIITTLANLEEHFKGNLNAISPDYIFSSSRYRYIAGGKIKCWSDHKNGKHSNQTIKEALNNSCNPCFTDMALSLGSNVFYDYITKLNFGKATGIDFPGEASGMLIPSSAVTEGDLARIGFGQSIAVTPIQLAAAAAAAVNGGTYYTPKIVSSVKTNDGKMVEVMPNIGKTVATKQSSAILCGYLQSVVEQGSGKQCFIEGYKIGGKTGTAQKFVNGAILQGKYVMSFLGFFPTDNPKYLCLVIIDEPQSGQYGSTVAAPVAAEIFQGIINAKSIKANL